MRDVFHLQSLLNGEILNFVEKIYNLLVRAVSKRPEQSSDQELAAAATTVDIDIEKVVLVELDFDPCTAVGD